MAPRKKRVLGTLLLIILSLVILAGAFILTAKPFFNIDIRERIRRKNITATSVAVLREVRDLFSFQTVEYVYKIVFPYDFAPADYDWKELLRKRGTDTPLTPREREYEDLYTFCKNIGIDLLSNKYEFVVLTAVVRGGYDLKGTIYEEPESYEEISRFVRIDRDTETLFLRLPEPEIVDFVIEDPVTENYSYPDIRISPENWKLLTTFTSERVKDKVLAEGILSLARKRGEGFIQKILIDAGLRQVVFLNPDDQGEAQ